MPVSPDADPTTAAERIERRDHGPLIDTMLLIAGLLVLWQAGSMLLGREALPSPAATVMKLAAILGDSDFPAHAWETARAFVTALVIALCSGLAIGLALGANRLSGEVAEPLLVGLYAIPKITLYPVILLLFGLGISAKIAFGVIHGVIPVIVFTMNAVRNIKGVYFRAARTMQLSVMQTAFTIGNHFRLSRRLRADIARHPDRRDVRLAARHRLHARARHGDQRHAHRDGAGVSPRRAGHCSFDSATCSRSPLAQTRHAFIRTQEE
jgi:hypothetical protein